ncbi:MAG: hypothetical protein ACYTFI_00780 [Planctomycetota bacterium]|jgi:hypothetical protein
MGAPVPESVQEYPERVHGIKHWIEYTRDAEPSQYHAIWRYMNGAIPALANVHMTINPGYLQNLGAEDPQAVFAALVAKYEEGKTADEIVVLIEAQGFSQMFVDAWSG